MNQPLWRITRTAATLNVGVGRMPSAITDRLSGHFEEQMRRLAGIQIVLSYSSFACLSVVERAILPCTVTSL